VVEEVEEEVQETLVVQVEMVEMVTFG